jgi:hypothetical protein
MNAFIELFLSLIIKVFNLINLLRVEYVLIADLLQEPMLVNSIRLT